MGGDWSQTAPFLAHPEFREALLGAGGAATAGWRWSRRLSAPSSGTAWDLHREVPSSRTRGTVYRGSRGPIRRLPFRPFERCSPHTSIVSKPSGPMNSSGEDIVRQITLRLRDASGQQKLHFANTSG